MNQKGGQSADTMYKNLKREYDELLEKNQNDLIKIKMREKQLNDKIAGYQKQNQSLKEQLELLKDNMKKKGMVVKSINEGTGAEQQVKELLSRVQKKDQQIQAFKQTLANLLGAEEQRKEGQGKIKEELSLTKKLLESANKQCKLLKKEIEQNQSQWEKKLQAQIDASNQLVVKQRSQKQICIEESQQKVSILELKNRELQEKLNKQQSLANQLQQKLKQYTSEFMKLSQKYEGSLVQKQKLANRPCDGCKDLQQKVELNEEMLKSVKMMLKFKEMELQKYKK